MADYHSILASHALPLANIQLWLDASDASTITLTSGAVSNWADKSGNAIDFAQATATNRPIVMSAEQNGRDVIRFDGIDNYLIHSTSILLKNLSGSTVYMVNRLRSNTSTRRDLLSISRNDTGGARFLFVTSLSSANKYQTAIRSTDAGSPQIVTSTNNSGTSWKLLHSTQLYTAAASSLYLNNVSEGSGIGTMPISNTSNTNSAQTTIGCGMTFGAFADIDVAEILVYNVNHSAAQRTQVWNYLKAKWNL